MSGSVVLQYRRFLLYVAFLLSFGNAFSQQLTKRILNNQKTIWIDSNYIIPGSVKVRCADSNSSPGSFRITGEFHSIELDDRWPCENLIVSYHVIYRHELGPYKKREIITDYSSGNNSPSLIDVQPSSSGSSGGLNTSGVMLRGISFGNAQDMVLNSSLNLRMSGKLSDNLQVEAALTDQEYPFQPEGTTTTLQDFDRIYIKAFSNKWSVLLGDHSFSGPSGAWYSKFAKKNRGINVGLADTVKNWKTGLGLDASVARGRFARNEIKGVEGLQGPYRLTGAANEAFIIIVSGTESVYLDGEKMERGYQADYIIDYNLGEITFTPKRIIGQNHRIVVEFQYSDRFYSRVVGAAHGTADNGKWKFTLSSFTETDLKNQPIQQDLTLFDSTSGLTAKSIMELAGDDQALASMSGIRKSPFFNPSLPNYILKDSAGIKFYEYAPREDSGQVYYSLQFTYTGNSAGNYTLAASSANGKVYRYAGEGRGDYKPLLLLRTPNRSSLHEAGIAWSPNQNRTLRINLAASGQDQNLFSPIDDQDNRGRAAALFWKSTHRLKHKNDSSKTGAFIQELNAEWSSDRFATVERFRDVEFSRIWNRDLHNAEKENAGGTRYFLYRANLQTKTFRTATRMGLNQKNGMTAGNASLSFDKQWNHFYLKPGAEISKAEFQPFDNQFTRFWTETGFKNKTYSAGAILENERSFFSDKLRSDSLWSNTYGFNKGRINLEKQAGKLRLQSFAEIRDNFGAQRSSLSKASRATTAGIELNSQQKNGFVKAGAWIRRMELLDSAFVQQFQGENHLSGRFEWSFPTLLKALGGNIFWQSISGREQERQFSYFEVPAGRGFFTWIDFNGNNIQEINEFVDAPFKDQARFIRLLVPTGNYIRSQNSEWTGNLNYSPALTIRGITFKDRFSWNLSSRSTDGGIRQFLPGLTPIESNELIAANYLLRHQADIIPQNGHWLLQYTELRRGNKNMFTNGPEYRRNNSQSVFLRLNFRQDWQLRVSNEWKSSRFYSSFNLSNSFSYTQTGPDAEIMWQKGTGLRITLGLRMQKADSVASTNSNESKGIRLNSLSEYRAAVSQSLGKNGMLDLKCSLLNYRYTGPKNTPLAFDLLQGFTSGNNIRLNLDLRFSAARNVQVVCGYESRKSSEVKWIHVGRAEARYLF